MPHGTFQNGMSCPLGRVGFLIFAKRSRVDCCAGRGIGGPVSAALSPALSSRLRAIRASRICEATCCLNVHLREHRKDALRQAA